MGIDLFLEKPNSSKEIAFLLDCIESLLDRKTETGFRGVQSKSLVDIIQLECLSLSSSTLRISQGTEEGKIWIQNGEIIDAQTGDVTGAEAFRTLLSWKTGHFEMLPADPTRTRVIFTSYQGLLLEAVHEIDEAQGQLSAAEAAPGAPSNAPDHRLLELGRMRGVEFVLEVPSGDCARCGSWGLDNPEQVAAWTHHTVQNFQELGERLQAGILNRVEGRGPMQTLAAAARDNNELCVGFHRSLSPETVRETLRKILTKWAS
jgi:hypothetical protein